ncbi:MAG: alpha-xylosidase [Polyangiaceae bacterium]
MRFGDGAWRMLDGVTATYLARIDAVDVEERRVLCHVSSRPESERWATLHGHMFSVAITSPAANVFRVRVSHHLGRHEREPSFQLAATPQPLGVTRRAGGLTLRAGALELAIEDNPWALRFVDSESGDTLTQSPFKALAMMEKAGAGTFLREQLTLGVGEQVYGLGERFQAFARNGQTVDMWNSDCGTCSDKGYKDVPFFMTSRGYGVLVNSPSRVSFEIGTEQVMRAQFAVPGEDLDYFFILGPSPKQVLERLGALSGRPALPPAWSFGLWLTTSFTTQYDEATVQSFVDGMAERDIPLHVFHFDCFWMKAHHWCNFEWDKDSFPDPEGMLARLHAKGLRVCVWINPYIAERSQLFAEGARKGYLLRRPNGDVYQRAQWQAGMGYVDFTNPEATRWFQDQLRRLARMGVDCFKTDFGEEIPVDVVYADGAEPASMHNYYTYLYNKAVFEVLEEERGRGEACLFARSATATCQRFPVHWGGDCYGNYESMAESLRGGLSLGLCGFGFWSHDIGGFESKASASVYKRWIAFGLLSSHSRLHGSTSYRVPWLYDEEACDVLRHFTVLKCRLMPYLLASAVQAAEASQPMMRAMLLEFPDDPSCRGLDRQYMLGDALLVAPVFHDSKAEYYLPHGEWTHLLSGERREGGRWCFDELDFFGVPLWLRPNALVCVGESSTQVDYDLTRDVRLVCGKLDARVALSAPLYDARGRPVGVLELVHEGNHVRVRSESLRQFEVHLPWAASLTQVERGTSVAGELRGPLTPRGVLVRASDGEAAFSYGE